MTEQNIQIAFIVATKDRPDDLRTMLKSVAGQSVVPAQIVIVDGSEQPVQHVVEEFPDLHTTYLRHWPPSAAAQRNAGLQAVEPQINLIGFMDDDIVLDSDAVERMLEFWQRAPEDVAGAGFNWMNMPERSFVRLKTGRFVSALGLYSNRPGGVAASGWQNIPDIVMEDTLVEWLPSGAVVWRREIFDCHEFDEYFRGYSYLEDLDFSYSVARQHKLAIVAAAKFRHYPSPHGRASRYRFGKMEVDHRLYFVKKHQLSVGRCLLGMAVRMAMTVGAAVVFFDRQQLERARGNVVQLASYLRGAQQRRKVEYVQQQSTG